MRIKVIPSGGKRKIRLILPTRAIKWRFVWRFSGHMEYYPMAKKFYKALKIYIKNNGHFTLVEVNSADGDFVKIVL